MAGNSKIIVIQILEQILVNTGSLLGFSRLIWDNYTLVQVYNLHTACVFCLFAFTCQNILRIRLL